MTRSPAALAWTLALSCAAAPALAQAPNPAMAEALFEDGQRLFKAGQIHEACGRFAQSQKLDPQLGTLLNLALCHERDGRTASAWAEYLAVVDEATRAGQKERVAFARTHAEALAPRVPRVLLQPAAGAKITSVKVDGTALDEAAWSVPIPLDPGRHEVELGAPGKATRIDTIQVSTTPGTQTVPVGPLEDAPAQVPVASPAMTPSSTPA